MTDTAAAKKKQTVRCAVCGRTISRRSQPGREDQPAYCHRSVGPECYTAYRKWRYKHDAEYRSRTLAYNRDWKRARKEVEEDA